MPIFEGDDDVIEEVPVCSCYRPEWETDDAEEVEMEDGDVFIGRIGRRRPRLPATIIDGMCSLEHF